MRSLHIITSSLMSSILRCFTDLSCPARDGHHTLKWNCLDTRFIFPAALILHADQWQNACFFYLLWVMTIPIAAHKVIMANLIISSKKYYMNVAALPWPPCRRLNLLLPSIPCCPRPGPSGWTSESCTAPATACPGRS